jgi:hypothetical protein
MRGAIAVQSLGIFERYVDEMSGTCGATQRSWTIRPFYAPRSMSDRVHNGEVLAVLKSPPCFDFV